MFSAGGWILDDFPKSREQWTALDESTSPRLRPDIIVWLVDSSQGGETLFERWKAEHPDEAEQLANMTPAKSPDPQLSADGEEPEGSKKKVN